MCERRSRKIKKGSPHAARLREARRLQRLVSPVAVAAAADVGPVSTTPIVDKNAQCRLILELALKTISLMHKNTLIQQKIIALQKETSDFVASVMSNPENKRRYMEHINLNSSVQLPHEQLQHSTFINNGMPLKLEPKALDC